ncbi:DoxX family protein, partial [Klebsiella pneumoniae]|nr:DoxX family protein [Klebsiella pneumoniae]
MKIGTTWQTASAMLVLRLFAAYEFLESGLQKWNGENWFSEINDQFPFPFNLLPDALNWNLAMYAELLLPVLFLLGLATRLSALGLMVVTAVAWAAVHAGSGYNVCDNGYK